jgi:hypothetical protein
VTDLEAACLFLLRTAGLPEPEPQYRFAAMAVGGPGQGVRQRLAAAGLRDWRADFAYPERRILIECEGGTYTHGGHVRGARYREDCTKYNAAQSLGFRVYRVTTDMVRDGAPLLLSILRRELGIEIQQEGEPG